jgi:RNA polymerase sigma-70 factor (ECF subfamily)
VDASTAYLAYAASVRGYLRGQRLPDADDVLSEVFLQVARSLPAFDGSDDEVRRWIFTIARNRVVDDYRRRARRPRLSRRAVPEKSTEVDLDPIDPDLVEALAQVTPEQREVVLLRFVADLPLEEVAAVTGRSVGAVKSMQHRALAELARILGHDGSAVVGDG